MDSDACECDSWNERFQKIVSMPELTVEDKMNKYSLLNSVNKDFISVATVYAKTIISEYYLPEEKKSIKVKLLGGEAGGKKFLWRDILFKMVDSTQGPYEGNHEAASKALGHELKSVNSYFRCRISGIHVALQALIDYKGYRIIAQALLPIQGKKTLVIGSSNSNISSGNKNDAAFKKLQEKAAPFIGLLRFAANELNIREHKVMFLPNGDVGVLSRAAYEKMRSQNADKHIDMSSLMGSNWVTLYSACDVEGHIGSDGRFYIVDLGRTFPPESPRFARHLLQTKEFSVGQAVFAVIKNPESGGPSMKVRGVIRGVNPDSYEIGFNAYKKKVNTQNAPVASFASIVKGESSEDSDEIWEKIRRFADYAEGPTSINEARDLCAQLIKKKEQSENKEKIEKQKPIDANEEVAVLPEEDIFPSGQSIFWRLLRPEFVKHRGVAMIAFHKNRMLCAHDDDDRWKETRKEVYAEYFLQYHCIPISYKEYSWDADESELGSERSARMEGFVVENNNSVERDEVDWFFGDTEGSDDKLELFMYSDSYSGDLSTKAGYSYESSGNENVLGIEEGCKVVMGRTDVVNEPTRSTHSNDFLSPFDAQSLQIADNLANNNPTNVLNAAKASYSSALAAFNTYDISELNLSSKYMYSNIEDFVVVHSKAHESVGSSFPVAGYVNSAMRLDKSNYSISQSQQRYSKYDDRANYFIKFLNKRRAGAYSYERSESSRNTGENNGGQVIMFDDRDIHVDVENVNEEYDERSRSRSVSRGSEATRSTDEDEGNMERLRKLWPKKTHVRARHLPKYSSPPSKQSYFTHKENDSNMYKSIDYFGLSVERAVSSGVNLSSTRANSDLSIDYARSSSGLGIVQAPPTALSSDALSLFGRGDEECAERDKEVHEATRILIEELIPAVAHDLMMYGHPLSREGLGLTLIEYMHHNGINIRHTGLLRSFVNPWSSLVTEKASSVDEARELILAQITIRKELLLQCVLRTLKHIFRELQRRYMSECRNTSSEVFHKALAVVFLNLISCAHKNSSYFWRFIVTPGLTLRFGSVALSKVDEIDSEIPRDSDIAHILKNYSASDHLNLLLKVIVSQIFENNGSFVGKPVEHIPNELNAVPSRLKEICCISCPMSLRSILLEFCSCNGIKLSSECLNIVQPVVDDNVDRNISSANLDTLETASVSGLMHSPDKSGTMNETYLSSNSLAAADIVLQSSSSSIFHLFGFEFNVADIEDIVPVVKHMHQVDLALGYGMLLEAGRRDNVVDSAVLDTNNRRYSDYVLHMMENGKEILPKITLVSRLANLAASVLRSALKAMPDDLTTKHALADAYQTIAYEISGNRGGGMDGFPTLDEANAVSRDPMRNKMLKFFKLYRNLCAHTRCEQLGISYKADILGIVVRVKHKVEKKTYVAAAIRASSTKDKLALHISDIIIEHAGVSLTFFKSQFEELEKAGGRVIRFVPLIIDEEHATRGLKLLQQELLKIDCMIDSEYAEHLSIDIRSRKPVQRISDLDLRPVDRLPKFSPEVGFRVLAALMNSVVVACCRSLEYENAGDIRNSPTLRNYFNNYARLHHMLLYLASHDADNSWRLLASSMIRKFIEQPETRAKKDTPDLGRLLIYLLLSDYDWNTDKFAELYLEEALSRQVSWFVGSHSEKEVQHLSVNEDDLTSSSNHVKVTNVKDGNKPELAIIEEGNFVSPYRLITTFEITKSVPLRMLMFNVYFMRNIARKTRLSSGGPKSKLPSNWSTNSLTSESSYSKSIRSASDFEHLARDDDILSVSTSRITGLTGTASYSELIQDPDVSRHIEQQKRMLHLYNSSLGNPTAAMKANLEEEFESILKVKTYEEFLDKISLPRSPAEFNAMLTKAVRDSVSKGYIRFLRHADIQCQRAANIPCPDYLLEASCSWQDVYEKYKEVKASGFYDAQFIPRLSERVKQLEDTYMKNKRASNTHKDSMLPNLPNLRRHKTSGDRSASDGVDRVNEGSRPRSNTGYPPKPPGRNFVGAKTQPIPQSSSKPVMISFEKRAAIEKSTEKIAFDLNKRATASLSFASALKGSVEAPGVPVSGNKLPSHGQMQANMMNNVSGSTQKEKSKQQRARGSGGVHRGSFSSQSSDDGSQHSGYSGDKS